MNTIRLGDLADLRAGFGFPKMYQGRSAGDLPFAKVGDISRVGRSDSNILTTAGHFIDEVDLSVLKARAIPAGSTLFAKIGEAIRQEHRVMAGRSMVIDNNAMAAVPRPGVDPRYLFRFLQTISMYSMTSSTTVPALRKSDLELIPAPRRDLAEQQRIASILDEADELRTLRRRALAQLDFLTQSIFATVFGDLQALQKVSFDELCRGDFRNGVSPSTRGSVKQRVLTLAAVTGEAFDARTSKIAMFDRPTPIEQRVASSLLLICRGNGNLSLVGRGHFPSIDHPDLVYPDTVIAAKPDLSRMTPAFLGHLWNSPEIRSQLENRARTTNGTFKVNQSMLAEILLPEPPMSRQNDFSQKIAVVDELRTRYRTQLHELNALFKALQHRVFNGQL